MRMKVIYTIALLMFFVSVSAQKISFSDFSKEYLTTSGVIKTGEEVSGYYMVNKTEEGSGRKRVITYTLKILDHNLDLIGTKAFESNTNVFISSVVYNGANLAIRFVDPKEERVWIEVIDGTGNTINSAEFEYDSWFDNPEMAEMVKSYSYLPLQATEGGFLHYKTFFEKGRITSPIVYSIQFVPNSKDQEGWVVGSAEESESHRSIVAYMGANDQIVLNSIVETPQRSMDFKMKIEALNKVNGEKIFDYDLENLSEIILPGFVDIDNEKIDIYGSYGEEILTTGGSKMEGLAKITIDYSGTLIDEKYYAINTTIADQLNLETNRRNEIEGIGELFLQKIEAGAENGIVATFEGHFSKGASVHIADAVLLHLDETFDNPKVWRVNKPEKVFNNMANSAPTFLRMIGAFDFEFQTKRSSSTELNVFFLNNIQINKNEEEWKIIYTTMAEEEFTVETIELDSSCSSAKIYPAQDGYIMIMEYFEEEKRLDTRLERLKM